MGGGATLSFLPLSPCAPPPPVSRPMSRWEDTPWTAPPAGGPCTQTRRRMVGEHPARWKYLGDRPCGSAAPALLLLLPCMAWAGGRGLCFVATLFLFYACILEGQKI